MVDEAVGIGGAMTCGGREFRWGSRTYVMGVVNVTPDSFSGDGLAGRLEDAVEQALLFEAQGADIIDVGAESTRPGHATVSVEEELSRLLPVLEGIVAAVSIPVSVDTYKPEVARRGVDAGAVMINDVWGPRVGEGMAAAAAEARTSLVLMHNQNGTGYGDLVPEVAASLARAAETAMAAGVPKEALILDPGIGFGKTADHNLGDSEPPGGVEGFGVSADGWYIAKVYDRAGAGLAGGGPAGGNGGYGSACHSGRGGHCAGARR